MTTILGPESVPKSAPQGYIKLSIISPEVQNISKALLDADGEVGKRYHFVINKVEYIARIEPIAPKDLNTQWAKGVVVYMKDPNAKVSFVETVRSPKFIGVSGGAVVGTAFAGPIGALAGGVLGYITSLIYKDVKKK
jgi:hypothetical protein